MPRNVPETLVGGAKPASQNAPAPAPQKRLFSAVELRLFRYTAVLFSLVTLTVLMGIVVWSFGWMAKAFYNLLLSLSLAGVLALVLYPVVEFLQNRLRLPRVLAVSLLMTAFILSIAGMLFLLVPIVTGQVVQLMTILPETLARWQELFAYHFPQLNSMLTARMENSASVEEVKPALKGQGKNIMSYLGILAGIGFVPLFLFFMLLSGDRLRAQATELLSIFQKSTQQNVLYFMDVFLGYVTTFFQGQLIIAASMGAMFAVSFALIGLKFGLLLGMVLGLLNIVPFLGTLIGLVIVLPMAYLQPGGGVQLLVLAGLVFAAVQLIESWLLTPHIMANRSGLHPALVVASLFFWGTALSGLIGMVLAVPLTAFFVAIWCEIKSSLKRTLSKREDRK